MDHGYIIFEVAENPRRDPIIQYREDGEIEIVFQITREQLDEAIIKNQRKKAK